MRFKAATRGATKLTGRGEQAKDKGKVPDEFYCRSKRRKMKLTKCLEDYVEAIYQISQRKTVAHANQIAEYLGVGKSSVSWALKQLSSKDLVSYAPYEVVTLTDKGRTVAQRVAGRHKNIKEFLVRVLGMTKEVAEANACRMEHVMDKDVMSRMRCFLQLLEDDSQARTAVQKLVKRCTEQQGQ